MKKSSSSRFEDTLSEKWLPDEHDDYKHGSISFGKEPMKIQGLGRGNLYQLSNISLMMQTQKPKKSYNPFKCPPDLQAAIEHGQSQRVCKPKHYMKNGEVINKLSIISDITHKHDSNEESKTKDLKQTQNKDLQIEKSGYAFSERFPEYGEAEANNNSRLCPCCGCEIDNVPIPINCNNTEFLHLGMTYPLYFDFIKKCAILLIVHFFISSIPSIVINVLSDQCGLSDDSSFVCTLSFLNILSKEENPSSFHRHALGFENLCNMIFLLASMILISIFKIQQKIKKQRLDEYHCSISDFSIFLTSLPKSFQMEELHDFLKDKLLDKYEEFKPDTPLDIIKEYKLYDLKEYASLYSHKINLYNKKLKKNKIQKKLMAKHALYVGKITDPEDEEQQQQQNNSKDGKDNQEEKQNQDEKKSQLEQQDRKQESQKQAKNQNNENNKFDINSSENQEGSAQVGPIMSLQAQSIDRGNNIQGQSVDQSITIENQSYVRNTIDNNPFKESKQNLEKQEPIEEEDGQDQEDSHKKNEISIKQPLTAKASKIHLQEAEKSQDKLKRIVTELAQLGAEQNQLSDELLRVDKKLADFEITMTDSSQDNERELKFSRRAIITFNSYDIAHKMHKAFKMTTKEKIFFFFRFLMPKTSRRVLNKFYFKDTLVKVERAPEPTDILWTNIGSRRGRIRYIIASRIVVYVLICISFAVLLLLKKSIKNEQAQQNSIVSLCLSFAASTVVALFNSLLGIAIRRGANYEEHNVQTKFFVSVGKNLTKMFIVNMVISTLMSNMVYYYISTVKQFPFDAQGLMSDFFFLFITNSYIGSIFNIFDIVWGFRLIQRYRAKKDSSTMTQMEANQLFEGHPIDMALRYANVNKTVLFTASVSPFIPIGVPLSIIGLLVTYWVDKYLLLRRYVCKNYLSYTLAKSMMNGFKIYAVFFSFGNMLTMFMPVSLQENSKKDLDTFVWPDTQKSPYFYISIFGFLVALSFRYSPLIGLAGIYNCIFKEKYQKRQIHKNYVDIQDDLADDYDLYHPIFKDKEKQMHAGKEFQAKSKNALHQSMRSDSEYSQMFKSIQNQIDFHQRNK